MLIFDLKKSKFDFDFDFDLSGQMTILPLNLVSEKYKILLDNPNT